MKIETLTISQIHQGLIKKEFSCQEITKAFLEKIKSEDQKIGAFLTLSEELALSQAQKIDKLISQGKRIPVIAGVPCAIKDNILVQDIKCTAGSRILENYFGSFDATCIKKLKEKGVVILGKTNLDEFAMGSSTERSAFKITHNPYDLTRVPGGSSGGSAAAVARGECCFSLGSDTGGSIRQPAAFCGTVGLKPTYGAVSRYGLIAFASSLDQIGPITKNVEDAEIVFEVIRGRDDKDSTTVELNSKSEQIQNNFRLGIPKEYFGKGIDKKVKEIMEKAIEKAKQEGVKIEEISLPHTNYALACYYIIAPSEASANLARYDGIRYGGLKMLNVFSLDQARGSQISNLLEFYLKIRGEGFGEEVKRRIMLGTFALSSGYREAYYLRAQKIRTKILEDFQKAFQKIDLIFTPVSPTLPFKIGEKLEDPLKMYFSDIFTIPVNLAGLPALSLPLGKIDNLPVGGQIIGPAWGEGKIFKLGKFFEKIWNPPLTLN